MQDGDVPLPTLAMEYDVQRLQMRDVLLFDLPVGGGKVEAKLLRAITRTHDTVSAMLRVEGRDPRWTGETALSRTPLERMARFGTLHDGNLVAMTKAGLRRKRELFTHGRYVRLRERSTYSKGLSRHLG